MERITVGEFCSRIEHLPLVKRQAVLFCLETGLTPKEVMALDWPRLKTRQLTPFARHLACAQPRHIRLNYIFWQTICNGAAGPLFDLSDSFDEAAEGLSFDQFKRLYDTKILIDDEVEARDFLEQFQLAAK